MPEDRDEIQGGEGEAGEIPAAARPQAPPSEPLAAEGAEPKPASPDTPGTVDMPAPARPENASPESAPPHDAKTVEPPAASGPEAPESESCPAGDGGPAIEPSVDHPAEPVVEAQVEPPAKSQSAPSAESAAGPASESAAPTEETAGEQAPPPEEAGPASPPEAEAVPGDVNGYQIRLRNFEGPLDLLLFLIKKKKVEINDIPIAVITREYLAYLGALEQMDIDREAEFLLMAAVLIYIKSQTLLPREQVLEPDVVPRQRSTDHLMPYDRIKAVVGLLRDKEEEQSAIWQRSSLTAALPDKDLDLVEVSLFDLAESFFALMKRKQAETTKVFKAREINMADKMAEIVEALKAQGALDFLDYLWAQETLEEALIAFFCLLELIKARAVMAVQEQLFHTIKVWLRKDAPEKDAS